MRKLFDSTPKKKAKKLKPKQAPKRYRSNEYTYSELYSMTEGELKSIIAGGTSERNRVEAREILKKRAMERLFTYGY